MIAEAPKRPNLHPSIVLAAYVEPLVRGRRVAVIGNSEIGLASEITQRGARLVHAYDPDPVRTAEALARSPSGASRHANYAVFAVDLGVRDGAFDVVIVPELSAFADPADLMRRVRRLCSADGVAVFVAPNTGVSGRRFLGGSSGGTVQTTPGYYELYDLVSLQFAKVRMIGQAPFVGYTVAELGASDDPDVSVDASLLAASEEPEYFIAVASDRGVSIEPYSVVELPWQIVAESLASSNLGASLAEGLGVALKTSEERVRELSALLQETRAREATPAPSTLGHELEARLKDAEARAGDSHVRSERLTQQIHDLEEELRKQRDRGTRLSKQVDDERRTRTKVELELAMLRGRPDLAGARDRIDALTAELDDARGRIAELTHDSTPSHGRSDGHAGSGDAAARSQWDALQEELRAALRDAAELAAQRDTVTIHARKLEVDLARLSDQETALASEQKANRELVTRAAVAEAKAAAAEKRLVDERERLVAAQDQASVGTRRLVDAESRLTQAAQLEANREAQRRERETIERELEEERARARKADAELREGRAAAVAADAEIARLEATLRERGHRIAELEREVREGQRVGKELVNELESARAEARPSLAD
jgi:hypothetical protein